MNTLEIFQFNSLNVRVFVNENSEPEFCATDVTKILGYSNGPDAISKHCNSKGIAKRDTLTSGGLQSLTYISEGNLYRLILKSEKPEAEPFETWVCDEVIPSIRKHGAYMTSNASITPMSTSEMLLKQAQINVEIEKKQKEYGLRISQIEDEITSIKLQNNTSSFIHNIGTNDNEKLYLLLSSLNENANSLSRKLGIHPTNLYHIISGRNKLSDKMIERISSRFNVSPNWLKFGVGDMFIDNIPQEIYLPVPEEKVPEITLRDKIRLLVNKYSNATGTFQKTIWDNVYQTLYYNYHISIKSYVKIRKDETYLEVAERKEHLDKIYTIISNMVSRKMTV